MSVRLFEGFDFSTSTANAFGSTVGGDMMNINTSAASAFAVFRRGPYLFHNKGVPTLGLFYPPNGQASTSVGSCFASRGTAGLSYGQGGSSMTSGAYTGATATTRAVYAAAQGFQLGIVRSLVLPALTDNEYWFSFEVKFPLLATSSLSGFTPSEDWGAIFKWGDVALKAKETTFISGNTHDVTFSVINNGAEIATIVVPNVVAGAGLAGNTFILILARVKLHNTTGHIEFIMNGVPQSVAYTNQNTVQAIAEADATAIFLGPAVLDNGTTAYPGHMDNILIDDAEWPAGIPTVRLITLLSDNTLTDAAAAGTGVTTVANALTSMADAKQLRFSSSSGKAILDMTMPSTAGFLPDILGFYGYIYRIANRSPIQDIRLGVAIRLASVESDDPYVSSASLGFSSIVTPPETNGGTRRWEIFEKPSAGGKYQTSELGSITTVIKATT